jgi:hypothetical protein
METNFSQAELYLIIAIVIIFVLLFLIPYIFYLSTLSSTIKLCAEHNQALTPNSVWRVFIPIYGNIWHFIMVGKIADTIHNELRERNQEVLERPGYSIGITSLVLQLLGVIPKIGGIFSLAGLVCWIIYWVKINEYKQRLLSTASFNKTTDNF